MVWKKNRVLPSSTQGVSAKLAPKYVGPYVIMERTGTNTYKLADCDGRIEELVHSEHLKSYVQSSAEEYQTSPGNTPEDTHQEEEEDPLPPGENEEAMSDPPSEREAPPAGGPSNARSSAQDVPGSVSDGFSQAKRIRFPPEDGMPGPAGKGHNAGGH